MGLGVVELPTGEYRFTGEYVSVESGKKLYIDPSIWCIHGKYQAFEKCIITESNVSAHLAQIHPFSLGWLADFHMFLWPNGWRADAIKEQIDRVGSCNPTLTVFGGDIASGSGGYCPSMRGDVVEKSCFGDMWNYSKDKLSNNLWLKGNHDIDPGCYYYYDWFERLWCLKLGLFKFIGFDAYNEQSIIPETADPYLSLLDIVWLRKRLAEDGLGKVILAHFPLDQWYSGALLAFKDALNIKCALAGHVHDLIYKEVSNIPMYINGTCRDKNIEVNAATINTFTKDGSQRSILIEGDIQVISNSNSTQITAPRIISWEKGDSETRVPIRLVKRINNHYLNLIMYCPSESTNRVEVARKGNQGVEVVSDVETYIIGKEIYSKDTFYDSWICSCGATWNSYYIGAGKRVRFDLGKNH